MSSSIFSLAEWRLDTRRPSRLLSLDKTECACQRRLRNSLVSMVAVNEEACSPPVRRRDVHIAITPHPTREFDKGSELTPPNNISSVVDQSCVGPVRSNKLLLEFLMLPSPLIRLARGEVEEGAPAATPHPIMFLDHSLKIGPCGWS